MTKSLGFYDGLASHHLFCMMRLETRREVNMGIDVDIIFKIAGVGIVVAFCTRFLIRWERRNMPSGSRYSGSSIFCSWWPPLWMICFKRSNRSSYIKDRKGGPTIEIIQIVGIALVVDLSGLDRQGTKTEFCFSADCICRLLDLSISH